MMVGTRVWHSIAILSVVWFAVTAPWTHSAPADEEKTHDSASAQEESAAPATTLDSSTILVINDENIPAEWFLSDLRSATAGSREGNNIVTNVFNQFFNRMLLYVMAKQHGVFEDPAVMQKVQDQRRGAQAALEHRVLMTGFSVGVNEYLDRQSMAPHDFAVSQEEMEQIYEVEYSSHPAAPKSLEDAPAGFREYLLLRLQQKKQQAAVSSYLQGLKTNLSIAVNNDLLESVQGDTVSAAGD